MFRVSHSLTLRRCDEVPGRWFKRLGMTSQINCNSKDFDFGSSLQKKFSGNPESTVTSSFEKFFRDTPFLCPYVCIFNQGDPCLSRFFLINEDD